MAEMKEVEVWIVMDSDGDYEIANDRDQALEYYDDNIGGSTPRRVVMVKVGVCPPEDTELRVVVPDDAGEIIAATA